MAADEHVLEQRTLEIGRMLFSRVRERSAGSLEGRLQRYAMEWGMRDERVKAQLFRFVDVLPALNHGGQVTTHLQQYLGGVRDRLPAPASRAIKWLPVNGWLGRGVASGVRAGGRLMARHFIAASDLCGASRAVCKLRERSLAFTIDLLGEAVLSEREAEQYQQRYFDLINRLADDARRWPPIPLLDRDGDGTALPSVNVSVKLSSLFSQFDSIDPHRTSAAVRERLRPILRLARRRGAFVNIDMEQYANKDLTLQIFREALDESEFRDWPDAGIAIQGYLRDSGADLETLAAWARRRKTPIWVRLVKGAYWDYESVIAAQNDWPLPVFSHKYETDANYERQSAFLIERRGLLRPAIASHNIRSIARDLALSEREDVPLRGIEFQMLYGMAEPLKAALAEMGHRVRVYTPFGDLLPGIAYLVRRLLENTSNESFLRAGLIEGVPEEQMLMNPMELTKRPIEPPKPASARAGVAAPDDEPPPFRNEPLADFSRAENRQAMRQALADVKFHLGELFPAIVNGKRIERPGAIESFDPSMRGRLVGRATRSTAEDARAAVAAAAAAFPAWRDVEPSRRSELLFRSARVMRRRRFELAAWEVYETGKPWREADGDVAEAIDYCEYYGRQMLRLARPDRRDVLGEENQTIHEPLGVAAVIAPWNFPLAILCGMSAAALVTGNTVVMKPAEQSLVIAAKLMEVYEEAGFPSGVVNYLPGIGEEVGPALVEHPEIAIIAFTGSRAVGLEIQAAAARVPAGQDHVKRVITEMGGKNAVILDDDADLDEAVHGVVASAFGYAGQKCSACSRAIVLDAIYAQFLQRLIDATASLKIAKAEDPDCAVGPVIDPEAQNRIRSFIERGKAGARLAYSAEVGSLADEGAFIGPHIFAEVPPEAAIAREEIFGPVLCVQKATTLDQAIAMANDSQYALTGGLYSRSPANITRARRAFRVGNLYINRKITGALVDRQPFGGFKLSGTGTKAGGSEYLLNFLWPRTITENTLRHGFAPAEE